MLEAYFGVLVDLVVVVPAWQVLVLVAVAVLDYQSFEMMHFVFVVVVVLMVV